MGGNTGNLQRRAGAVLIVDDDAHMCGLLASLARSLGYPKILQTGAPDEALDYLNTNTIAAAFIDLCLGDANGVQLIADMRQHRRSFIRETPIIALSGNGTHALVVEAMQAGADTFMSKPITIGKFEKSLWIAARKPRQAAPPQSAIDID